MSTRNKSNKVFFGFKNVHIAFIKNQENPGSVIEYETPIRIPGAVTWAPTPDNQESVFWADDMKYFVDYQNNGYSGDLTMAKLPDAVLADMLGWVIDANGVLLETVEGKPRPFALLFEINGDAKGRRIVFYHNTAGAPNVDLSTTTQTKEVKPQTIPVTATPIDLGIDVGGGKTVITKAVFEYDDNFKEIWDTFFDEVYLPVPSGVTAMQADFGGYSALPPLGTVG